MTIKPGQPWGEVVDCPGEIARVADDAALGAWLADHPDRPVRVEAGDLVRTVGGVSTGPTCRRYELDAVRVVLDHAESGAVLAVAHVVVRPPGRFGWWRGPLWGAMNVSRLGGWDVAPRAHPNDGKLDVVAVDASMGIRARLQARRRLPAGTHVPHPQISSSRPTTASWEGTRPAMVIVDGRVVGRARHVAVTVVPDAAVVYV